MTRKHNHARFHRFYRLIKGNGACVYCGVRATTIDHFVPISVIALISDAIDVIDGRVLLPACGECNTLAGSAIFRTVAEKRRFIHRKLMKRYRKYLDMPVWGEGEKGELGYAMLDFVGSGENVRRWVIDRLGWRNTSNRDPVELAKVRFQSAGVGKLFAARGAGRGGTTRSGRP